MKDHLKLYKEFVRPHYASWDVAHNFEHIERIINRLDLLSEGISTPPHRDRLYFLACFHGLGSRLRDNDQFHEQTIEFLQTLGWSQAEIQELFQSLERHLRSPETLEEEIIHDANYLETLGAFGIAKAFTMGGILGQSYEETINYFENHSLGKIVFRTPVGRHLAEEGRKYTRAFVKRLRRDLQMKVRN